MEAAALDLSIHSNSVSHALVDDCSLRRNNFRLRLSQFVGVDRGRDSSGIPPDWFQVQNSKFQIGGVLLSCFSTTKVKAPGLTQPEI